MSQGTAKTIPVSIVDAHPFSRGGSVCLVMTSLMHTIQAILLFIYPASIAGGGTGVASLLMVFHQEPTVVAWILLVTAWLAFCGTVFRLGYIRLALFLPQQIILSIMALGACWAVAFQHYADGTARPWPFILADQAPLIVLLIVHSTAILRRAREPNG